MEHQEPAPPSELVSAIRERLRRLSLPRLQMLIVVMLTGLSGFLTSVVLFHWHLRAMWLRYGLCVALAYLVFLLLLRVWVHKWSWFAPHVSDVFEGPRTPDTSESSGASRPSETPTLDWLRLFAVFNIDIDEVCLLLAFFG